MSFPHFTNIKRPHNYIEPIYQRLYDVRINTNILSKEEKFTLSNNICKISNGVFEINTNDNFNVENILLKIKDENFNIEINIHDKTNITKGIYIFKDCEFENLLEELINYKWDSEEIMKYKLKFKYEKLELIHILI